MIPNTLSPKDQGGDGDALDVLILGPALPLGTVARVHLIGVMNFLDKGEQDDKLLAVMNETPLGQIRSLKELNESFPGVAEMVHLWFTKYKGPGKMTFQGWGDIEVVEEILQRSMDAARSTIYPNIDRPFCCRNLLDLCHNLDFGLDCRWHVPE